VAVTGINFPIAQTLYSSFGDRQLADQPPLPQKTLAAGLHMPLQNNYTSINLKTYTQPRATFTCAYEYM
jgi:hypothetical protein